MAKFLAHYLKDGPDPKLPEALTFRTGKDEWIRHDSWPPKKNISPKQLYFQANGKLSFDKPAAAGDDQFDSYISDPANPVPYRARPITVGLGGGWRTWQLDDQRFSSNRPDVVSWVTDPLEQDVTVSGKIIANLFAATTGTDSDWIVKLMDVYPDDYKADAALRGYQLMIAGDVFRGRYRSSFEKPEAITANSVQHYQIAFPANDHVFRKGHRIMVQVQSSWFPIIDRNPQRFVPNIFKAKESDFQSATQRIYRAGGNASYIAVPVEAAGN
jgi:putative CocE/NonD family hydrolase